ncbi:hypothetical protein GQ43DRAFT_382084 [Delitschia confertaspora ATCC 74209]|uniref:Glycosyltransferase family 34 protein n=1 Tax=Delitschia confertaspora ATCC 74209 TaxID=1513339 RepID=A0A9P4JCK4_9PLEO|nr:hypothetical protein GQ43DRAFT_382084 [Delitschia confertaspora ATCC 74209]
MALRIPRPFKRYPRATILLIAIFFFAIWNSFTIRNKLADHVQSYREPRVAIITLVTDEKSYMHASLKNKDYYARRHKHDFIVDYETHSERSVVWAKFDMIERLIKSNKYDWIWWMDFDTLITNTDIKITDVIRENLKNATNPGQIDYLLTHDCNGLNSGSYLVRGHARSLSFIDRVRGWHDVEEVAHNYLSEQDCMAAVLKQESGYKYYAYKVPQFQLNAFPEEIGCYEGPNGEGKWKVGAFVIHFAGAWAHVRGDDPTGQLMRKYKDLVVHARGEGGDRVSR